MKFLTLLVSIVIGVQAVKVRLGLDGLSGPLGKNNARVDINDFDENIVPISFDFTSYVKIEAPYETSWTYSINGIPIINGTEDFCNPNSMTPGGIAVLIMRYGLGFDDSDCPFSPYTRFNDKPWTWAEPINLDLDDIFETAATMLAGTSIDQTAPSLSDPNSPPVGAAESGGGMKRRRRDLSSLSIQLDTLNDCIDARFVLEAKANY